MGLRTNVAITVQAGLENDLDQCFFGTSLAEVLDTMDDGKSERGTIPASELNRSIDFGDVQIARLLYIEADGDLDLYFSGVAATAAQIDAVGAAYPTGFVGGETVDLTVDATSVTVTFDAADQTLTAVINRINAAFALAGLPTPIASANGGQVRLTSPTTGATSLVSVDAETGAGASTIGLTVASTDSGTNPTPGSSAVQIRRMADPGGSQIVDLKAYALLTVQTTSLHISNPSATNAVVYRVLIVGDLTT